MFLEASYGTSQTSKFQPFIKKVNGLQPKTISAKKSTSDVWEDPKEYQLLFWWNLPQILTSALNLKIICRIPAPSLLTHPPRSAIKLPRIQIFKTGFRKLESTGNMTQMAWGVVVILSVSLWRIAYENRYVTHPLENIPTAEKSIWTSSCK